MAVKTWTETPQGSSEFECGLIYEFDLPDNLGIITSYEIIPGIPDINYVVDTARNENDQWVLNVTFLEGHGRLITDSSFPASIRVTYTTDNTENEIFRELYSGMKTPDEYLAAARKTLRSLQTWPHCKTCGTDKTITLQHEREAGNMFIVGLLVCLC